MHKKKFIKQLGKYKKAKNWEKPTEVGSHVLTNSGKLVTIAGTVSGQPEIAAAGAGMVVGGQALGHTSKLLKTKHKLKNKKK